MTLWDMKGLSQQKWLHATKHIPDGFFVFNEVIIGGGYMQCFYSPLHVYVWCVYLCDCKCVDKHVWRPEFDSG